MSNLLHHTLYISQLAPDHGPEVVPAILQVARATNPLHGITGVLVFDGERFAQLIEGPPDPLHKLMANIGRDVRHTHMRILHQGSLAQRYFADFSLGYADFEHVNQLEPLHGESAVAAFVGLTPSLDLSR